MSEQDASKQPSLQIVTQYIKDVSFENPHAPESLVSGWAAPETSVQISLGQQQLNENNFESSIKIRVEASNKENKKAAFIMDIHYGALVALTNIPKENIPAVLMVEVPKLLFPFLRETVAKLTTQGGYPPLYLAPISFEELYITEMKRLQSEQAKASND